MVNPERRFQISKIGFLNDSDSYPKILVKSVIKIQYQVVITVSVY